MFNSKGQASSVSNILIAGVIALAILGILMGLLGNIFNIQGDPIEAAQGLIKTGYRTPYVVHKSKEVVFDKDYALTAKAIAKSSSSVVPEQICFSVGSKEGYFTASNSLLQYTKSGSQKLKLSIYCDVQSELTAGLADLGVELVFDGGGPCEDLDDTEDICCVIFPVKPN